MGAEDLTDAELMADLCEIEEGLSEWEVEFVDDVSKRLERSGSLTDGQRRKAEEIWEENCG